MIGHVLHSMVHAKWFIPTTASIGAIATLTAVGLAIRCHRSKPANIEAEIKAKVEEINLNELTPGRQLGAGAFGSVNLYTRGDERYAVKSFWQSKHAATEFRIGQKLRGHSSFVQMYKSVKKLGATLIIMELVDGHVLHNREDLDFSTLNGKQILRELFEGYAYALKQGLVPADTHFGNLMITRDGHLKYIDLGLYFEASKKKFEGPQDKCILQFWRLASTLANIFSESQDDIKGLAEKFRGIGDIHQTAVDKNFGKIMDASKKAVEKALALLQEEVA